MNFSVTNDWRNRRNRVNMATMSGFPAFPIHSYHSDTKTNMELSFDETLVNNLHRMSNPLQKNLADTINMCDERPKIKAPAPPEPAPTPNRNDFYPSFAGIGSFISDMISNISSNLFKSRVKSPVEFYDCCDDCEGTHQGSPPMDWQQSKSHDQNKNMPVQDKFNCLPHSNTNVSNNMSTSRAVVNQCTTTLNSIRSFLPEKSAPTQPKFQRRRPRRVFVEAGSVEEQFEDAFSVEDFGLLESDSHIEYRSPVTYEVDHLLEIDSPKMKTEFLPINECMDIVKALPEQTKEPTQQHKSTDMGKQNLEATNKTIETCINKIETLKLDDNQKRTDTVASTPTQTLVGTTKIANATVVKPKDVTKVVDTKQKIEEQQGNKEIVTSCEDKASKLLAMLQERKRKNTRPAINSTNSVQELATEVNEQTKDATKPVPITKSHDKRHKNPRRLFKKRDKAQMKLRIQDDMSFGHEIEADIASSVENSPAPSIQNSPVCVTTKVAPTCAANDSFNEITGRFASTSSIDDEFQIVLSDVPKTRCRKMSDCDSEDSFIVFEGSPDTYTCHDVFGDTSDDESEDSDSNYTDSELSDSGYVQEECQLKPSMCRTVGDLTEGSLYDVQCDEVDCAGVVCEELSDSACAAADASASETDDVKQYTGLLVNEARKMMKKKLPPKKVSFSEEPAKVHVMRVWAFAARQARIGHWEQHARDQDRFRRKIADVDMAISWVLKPQHRRRVMFQRFMPWWNKMKREETAQRRARAEEERREKEMMKQQQQEQEEEGVLDAAVTNGDVDDSKAVVQHKYCDDLLEYRKCRDFDSNIDNSNGVCANGDLEIDSLVS